MGHLICSTPRPISLTPSPICFPTAPASFNSKPYKIESSFSWNGIHSYDYLHLPWEFSLWSTLMSLSSQHWLTSQSSLSQLAVRYIKQFRDKNIYVQNKLYIMHGIIISKKIEGCNMQSSTANLVQIDAETRYRNSRIMHWGFPMSQLRLEVCKESPCHLVHKTENLRPLSRNYWWTS